MDWKKLALEQTIHIEQLRVRYSAQSPYRLSSTQSPGGRLPTLVAQMETCRLPEL